MADDELVRLLASDPNNPILKQRSSQMWGGLKSYLPEQPEVMKSAQGMLARGLGAVPPEAMLMLNFLGRSPVGAMKGRDSVIAHRLDRTAWDKLDRGRPNAEPDLGVTGGFHESSSRYPHSQSAAGMAARNPDITSDPFRAGISRDEVRFWVKQTPANRLPPDLDLLPGGKK